MPLHLLSKKSWNVYNPAAIALVRADEAAAEAREEAHEQRLQEYEAAKRLGILRGQTPPASPPPPEPSTASEKRPREQGQGYADHRKKRRLAGEDDTDRDIRVARQVEDERKQHRDNKVHKGERGVPLNDHAGHIQLFAPPSTREIRAGKDAAAIKADAKRKRTEEENADRVTMRFSNAAGFRTRLKDQPWYAKGTELSTGKGEYTGTEDVHNAGSEIVSGKDAFGNADPGRLRRDAARTSTADPMSIMVKAQKKLKEVEKEREARNRERERDLNELAEMQESRAKREARRAKKKKRLGSEEEQELEGFSLDADEPSERHRKSSRHHSHRSTHTRHGGSNHRHRKRSQEDRHPHRSQGKHEFKERY